MAIRSASDVLYTAIAKLPFLIVVVGVVWVLCSGLLALETFSFGTEYFIGNDQTANALPSLPGVGQQDVLAAIESGDTERMTQVLDQLEAEQAARGAQPVAAPVAG